MSEAIMGRSALLAGVALSCFLASPALAQDDDDAGAITARVHGTFLDRTGGLGVLSGDMAIVRFEVRNGTVTAVGRIVGSLADAAGAVLGQVAQDLALPVSKAESTCNQLRLELAATDAVILQTLVHFDAEVAGFDSRDGASPKALGVLCAAGELLRGKPSADSVAAALEAIALTVKAAPAR